MIAVHEGQSLFSQNLQTMRSPQLWRQGSSMQGPSTCLKSATSITTALPRGFFNMSNSARERIAEIIGTPFVLQVYWDRKRGWCGNDKRLYSLPGMRRSCYAITENETQKKLETVISAWSKALNILDAGVCDENL